MLSKILNSEAATPAATPSSPPVDERKKSTVLLDTRTEQDLIASVVDLVKNIPNSPESLALSPTLPLSSISNVSNSSPFSYSPQSDFKGRAPALAQSFGGESNARIMTKREIKALLEGSPGTMVKSETGRRRRKKKKRAEFSPANWLCAEITLKAWSVTLLSAAMIGVGFGIGSLWNKKKT